MFSNKMFDIKTRSILVRAKMQIAVILKITDEERKEKAWSQLSITRCDCTPGFIKIYWQFNAVPHLWIHELI